MPPPYPRDLIGYGATPPHAQWPGDARIALQFVINYEEGAENSILHGDPASEAFLSEIVGAEPVLGSRHMNIESLFEYGSRAGFWRLHRVFAARSVTVYGVALARNPEAVAAMLDAGWKNSAPARRRRSVRRSALVATVLTGPAIRPPSPRSDRCASQRPPRALSRTWVVSSPHGSAGFRPSCGGAQERIEAQTGDREDFAECCRDLGGA
jgi:peptidoglycan/xylan/chitin deacetylase (PgdA/CDA1 family)